MSSFFSVVWRSAWNAKRPTHLWSSKGEMHTAGKVTHDPDSCVCRTSLCLSRCNREVLVTSRVKHGYELFSNCVSSRACFKENFTHKFRATLGKNRVIFPGEKVSYHSGRTILGVWIQISMYNSLCHAFIMWCHWVFFFCIIYLIILTWSLLTCIQWTKTAVGVLMTLPNCQLFLHY